MDFADDQHVGAASKEKIKTKRKEDSLRPGSPTLEKKKGGFKGKELRGRKIALCGDPYQKGGRGERKLSVPKK